MALSQRLFPESSNLLRRLLILLTFCPATFLDFSVPLAQCAQDPGETIAPDGDQDRDGLEDGFEQEILLRFEPTFMVSSRDCDGMPAEFLPGSREPRPVAKNGTIYGQVFPVKPPGMSGAFVEIHYYHLWTRDCGRLGHELDVEHISGLIRADGAAVRSENWKAVYWHAAAHEGTVCDASNAASADVLYAEDKGPIVWVSEGKHASFLSLDLCRSPGCGGDRCRHMAVMQRGSLINIGEPGFALNGAVWAESALWPLSAKMGTEFDSALLARLENRRGTRAARVNPATPPVQEVILAGDSILDAFATGHRHASAGLETGDTHVARAVGKGRAQVGKSLRRAWRSVADRFQGQRD